MHLRALVYGVHANMNALFDERYSHTGRPSIPPEHQLRALLLQILFTIRSERPLVEQLDYNLLFRWFVGLGMEDTVWGYTVFSINRDRLLGTDVARQLFRRVLHLAEWLGFVSDEHFSVDGTMIEAWASHKSFVPKDGSGPDKPAGRDGGGGQGLCTAEFVAVLERRGIKAHVTRKVSGSAVDGRTARGKGYAMSLHRQKMIEEVFGWIKTVGGLCKTRHKRLEKPSGQALFAFAAYSLTRMLSLMRSASA